VATVLDKIVQHKRSEVARAKAERPIGQILSRLDDAPPVRGFLQALKSTAAPALIAEIKKASPSAGIIRENFDPLAIAQTYESAGAACLSVLTDEFFFQGHLSYLEQIRRGVHIPVMRKEFIIDRYQIAEARSVGADCVLLIAECLTAHELTDLYDYCRELGMDALIELYHAENVDRVLATGCQLVGVNNRDLATFQTSLEQTYSIREQIPASIMLVSESGIRTHDDIARLRAADVGAVLVGESLMKQPDIASAVKTLMTDVL
jgi:indole-3-glycerol phosphate synthase